MSDRSRKIDHVSGGTAVAAAAIQHGMTPVERESRNADDHDQGHHEKD